jgi:hypothetical protein
MDFHRSGFLAEHTEWITLDCVDTLIKSFEDKDGNLTTDERGEMLCETGFLRQELGRCRCQGRIKTEV